MKTNEKISKYIFLILVWSEKDTKRLLELYNDYLPQTGPLKRFKQKKEMWSYVANEFPGKSGKQCEERYKTVLRRKKWSKKEEKSPQQQASVKLPTLKKPKIVIRAFKDDEDESANENVDEKCCLSNDSTLPDMQQITSEIMIKEEFIEMEEVEQEDDEEENNTNEEEDAIWEIESSDESTSQYKTVQGKSVRNVIQDSCKKKFKIS